MAYLIKPQFNDIDEIRSYYERTLQGHFFAPNTMRFFKSRLTSHFRQLNKTTYLFVTTERYQQEKRKATIRVCKVKQASNRIVMDIKTLGNFNALTIAQAKREMNSYVEVKS